MTIADPARIIDGDTIEVAGQRIQAVMRADGMLEIGDVNRCAVWKRILRAIDELLTEERTTRAKVHWLRCLQLFSKPPIPREAPILGSWPLLGSGIAQRTAALFPEDAPPPGLVIIDTAGLPSPP